MLRSMKPHTFPREDIWLVNLDEAVVVIVERTAHILSLAFFAQIVIQAQNTLVSNVRDVVRARIAHRVVVDVSRISSPVGRVTRKRVKRRSVLLRVVLLGSFEAAVFKKLLQFAKKLFEGHITPGGDFSDSAVEKNWLLWREHQLGFDHELRKRKDVDVFRRGFALLVVDGKMVQTDANVFSQLVFLRWFSAGWIGVVLFIWWSVGCFLVIAIGAVWSGGFGVWLSDNDE